jgi:hypothetical protein
MKRFLPILSIALSVVLMGAGCSLTQTVNINDQADKNINVAAEPAIAYTGQDGKNALELLQSKYQVDVSTEGFVNAINGQRAGDHQFWAFYVNGQSATVGAKTYQTKQGDAIEWKLENF